MVTATPESIGTVVQQILQAAADQASAAGNQLAAILDDAQQLGQDATALPEELQQRLKDYAQNPDWRTLLIFVLLQVRQLDEERLSVTAMQVEGWSRAVGLTCHTAAAQNLTMAVAVGDPDLRHGVHLRATGPLKESFGDARALLLSLEAKDECRWDWDFGAAITIPELAGTITVTVSWTPPVPGIDDFVRFGLGPLRLEATLSRKENEPLYTVRLGLGDRDGTGRPGIHAGGDLGPLVAATGGVLDLELPVVDYSPELLLVQGAVPRFRL